jgi:hypothetical protein
MKLSIDHDFAIAPADYARLYFDEPFSVALCAQVKLGRTLLGLDRTPDRVRRRVRCEPVRDVPAPLAKIIGGAAFHYVEELDFDLASLRGTWRVVPSIVPNAVDASGTLHFEPAANGGVRRSVRGGVTVSVFGIGAIAERFVVAEVLKGYEAASEFTRKYLAERPTA